MSSTINSADVENESDLRAWLAETILESDTEGEVYLVAPDTDILYELGHLSVDEESSPRPVTVLMSNDTRLSVRRNFTVESLLAGLPETFTFHVIDSDDDYDLPDMALVSTEFKLKALVSIGDEYTQLSTDSEETAVEMFKTYRELSSDRDEYEFRKPSRETIYETLEENFDTTVSNDYKEILSALEDTDDIEHSDIQADTIAILVAAKHGLPHYDLSKWAEGIGLVSKATVSRRKNAIETKGYIKTTKIPTDVGRPRQRLHLNEDHDEVDDSIDSLVGIAIKSANWNLQ